MTRSPALVVARLVVVAIVPLVVAQAADAQSSPRRTRREYESPGAVDPVSVRAEYASTLLQARRYREAAAEYRRLLQREPGNFGWRVNYARALAWGGAHRAAEVELKRLQARAPRNATVEELLRSVRASIDPSSREARAWVAERPNYTPYRLALARAFVRERRPRSAFEHFDLVVARQPSPELLSEAADARAAGGDRRGAAELYRRAVEQAPSNLALRRAYARALVASRQYGPAIEQYTLLAEARPEPGILVERAEARRQTRDEVGAERDLQASIELSPTPEAYTALGDLYRWDGRFRRARATYEQAVALRPAYRRARLRLARLAREERPGFGYASWLDERVGATVAGRTMTDNTGFVYASGEGRMGFPVGGGTVLGFGIEPRLVYDESPGGAGFQDAVVRRIVGAAATLGLAHTFHGEEVDTRIAGRAGVVGHTVGDPVPMLAGSAVTTFGAGWSLSLEGTSGPAYAYVMALSVGEGPLLELGEPAAELLTAGTFAVAVTVPFGAADVGAEFERMGLSDGNSRSAFQGSVRVPLIGGLSLLYTGGALGFAQRSALYWDPPEYISHAIGLEVGVRTDEGLVFSGRVLPGIGRAVEGLTPGDPRRFDDGESDVARFVGHVTASADLSVRRERWETALGAAYGMGRAGGYQWFDGILRVRYVP